ncbi:MAG: hypothetical protein ACP5R5_09580, partial [Armatimonadota bacterium]
EFEGLDTANLSGARRFSPGAPADDPVIDALNLFRWAASSRQIRLKRALLVQEIARAALKPRGAARQSVSGAWYDRAVIRLREEHLREIALGLQSDREQYEKTFRKLTRPEQDAVKRIRRTLFNPGQRGCSDGNQTRRSWRLDTSQLSRRIANNALIAVAWG